MTSVKRVISCKIGYALTSYQECSSCSKKIVKGDLNIINEEDIYFPVCKQTNKKFYHFDHYSVPQFSLAVNKHHQVEKIEGYNELTQYDQLSFATLIKLMQNQFPQRQSNPIQKNLQKSQMNNVQKLVNNQQNSTQNGQKVEGNTLFNRMGFKNGNQTNPVASSSLMNSNKTMTSSHLIDNPDGHFHHSSSIPQAPMKQQTLNDFKSVKNEQLSLNKENKNKQKQESKSFQQKMDFFKQDKTKINKKEQQQPSNIQKQSKESSSSEDEQFQHKSLNTKRNVSNIQNNVTLNNNNGQQGGGDKIITVQEKLQQLRQQKSIQDNNADAVKNESIKLKRDPKTKKRKLNNSDNEQISEQIVMEKKIQGYKQMNFDECDSDFESKDSPISQLNQKMLLEEDEDNLFLAGFDKKYNNKSDNMKLEIVDNNENNKYSIDPDEFVYNPTKNKLNGQDNTASSQNKSISVHEKNKKTKKLSYYDSDEDEEDEGKNSILKQFGYNKFEYLKQNKTKTPDQNYQTQSSLLTQGKVLLTKRLPKLSTEQTQTPLQDEKSSLNQSEQITLSVQNINNNNNNVLKQKSKERNREGVEQINGNSQNKIKRVNSSQNSVSKINQQNEDLLNGYTKEELVSLLKLNGYQHIEDQRCYVLKRIAADGMTFGSIPQCPSCKQGQLIYNEIKNEYYCYGSATCKVIYQPSEVCRKSWVT